MNKKTVFDKHLYKEGMRSLLPFGAILLGLLCIFSALCTAAQAFGSHSPYLFDQFASLSNIFCFLYFFIIIIVTPVLTLRIFSFLTTRNGSDFYHAIPHKKQCIYISYALAACSWISLCTVIPTLIGYLIYCLAGIHAMSFGMLVLAMLHIFVAALLVLSAISIALTVAGTMLTTIVTTGLILFFPRLFIYGCRLILCYSTDHLILGNGFFFGTRCNIVVQSFINFVNSNSYLFNIGALIYTLILSLLYILLAIFLFNKRPSELAMKSALSKKFQAGVCLLIGTAFSLIPIAFIINAIRYKELEYSDQIITGGLIFTLFTTYVLIIIAMGMYELLSTKKVRNLVHLIPRAGILIIINIVMFFGLRCGKNIVTSYAPESSDIKSISFIFSSPDQGEFFTEYSEFNPLFRIGNDGSYYDYSDYFTTKANAYSTSNEKVKTIIAHTFHRSSSDKALTAYSIGVTVDTGLKKVTRSIALTDDEYKALQKELLNDQAFTSIYTELPNVSKKQLSIRGRMYDSTFTGDTTILYETMREELASIGTVKYSELMANYNGDSLATIWFAQNIGCQYVTGSVPITNALPKTYKKYIELVNADSKDALKNFKELNKSNKEQNISGTIDYGIISPETGAYNNNYEPIWLGDSVPDVYNAFIDALISVENTPIDYSKKDSYLVMLNLCRYSRSHESQIDSIKFVQIDTATYSKLTKAIREYMEKDIVKE